MEELKKSAINKLQEETINKLLDNPEVKKLTAAMKRLEFCQKNLYALLDSDDEEKLTLLKIGTVFQIFLVDKLATGKSTSDLTEDDWKDIAAKVSKYAILEEGQTYSEFVFNMYADYIDTSAIVLEGRVREERLKEIKEISKKLRSLSKQMQKKTITEPDYVEECLWLSLEGMMKLLSSLLSSKLEVLMGDGYGQLTEAVSQLAFEYGRYVLYARENEMLDEYLQYQYELDEQLKNRYTAYMEEVNRQREQFESLIDDAFNPNLRDSLMQSAALARAAGVKEEEILRTMGDIDDFFME